MAPAPDTSDQATLHAPGPAAGAGADAAPRPADTAVADTFRDLPPLGAIETDRFCARCGYNLRQQPVRREPRTQLLLAQCPECGAFDPVGRDTSVSRLWMAWAGRALLVIWVGGLVLAGWIGGVVIYAFGYEFAHAPFSRHWYQGTFRIIERSRDGEAMLIDGLLLLGAALAGWILVSLMATLLPHWRRVGYVAVIAATAVLAGVVAGVDLDFRFAQHPDYFAAALRRLGFILGVTLLAGIAAACLGRASVRLLVRLLVPPAMRPPLAYLWYVDGKIPPPVRKAGP